MNPSDPSGGKDTERHPMASLPEWIAVCAVEFGGLRANGLSPRKRVV